MVLQQVHHITDPLVEVEAGTEEEVLVIEALLSITIEAEEVPVEVVAIFILLILPLTIHQDAY